MNLACDLGTANFRAGVFGSDQILSEPCVIAQDRVHGTTIGQSAYAMVGRNPDFIDITTPVEGGVIRNIDAAAAIFKYCAQHFTTNRFLERKFTLTIAIPSGLTPVEVRAMEDAAKVAGARDVECVNACVAAAIGAGLPVESPTGCLVVNLGGGVTEAALLSMKGVVASHSVRSGGQAVNEAIVDRVRKEYSFLIGMQSAETLKRTLCENSSISGCEVRGRNLKNGLPGGQFIPRRIVDEQVVSYGEAIVDLISQVISECPPELAGDLIERGIVLAGGGAHITGLVSRLNAMLEAPIVIPEEPENCTIHGLLNARWGTKKGSKFNVERFTSLLAVGGTGRSGDGSHKPDETTEYATRVRSNES